MHTFNARPFEDTPLYYRDEDRHLSLHKKEGESNAPQNIKTRPEADRTLPYTVHLKIYKRGSYYDFQ